MNNIFDLNEIDNFDKEIFEELLNNDKVKIERIVSYGQVTPENEWLEENKNEWVLLLQGEAKILFDEGIEVNLYKGSYLFIPANKRHRVTSPVKSTLHLACNIFLKNSPKKYFLEG